MKIKSELHEKFHPDLETSYELQPGIVMALQTNRPELIKLQIQSEEDPVKKELMRLCMDLLQDIDYLKQDVEMYKEGYHDVLQTMHNCLRRHT